MVSVIIPTTTGGFGHLVQLMPQLTQEKDIEIIVIDNDSRDGSANYLSTVDCLVKFNKIKMNFSKSNNYGAKIARGEFLLFLNNDTVPTVGFVQDMLETINRTNDVPIGIVGNLLYTLDPPKRVQHAGICFTQDYVPYELGLEISGITTQIPINDPRVSSVRRVPAVTAACLMIRKDVFNLVGGFDEEYINGWEDTDLNLKVRENGFDVWYTGKRPVYHKHFGSRGRFAFEKENRLRYDSIWVDTGRAKAVLQGFREA